MNYWIHLISSIEIKKGKVGSEHQGLHTDLVNRSFGLGPDRISFGSGQSGLFGLGIIKVYDISNFFEYIKSSLEW